MGGRPAPPRQGRDGTPTRTGLQIATASLAPVVLLGFLALAAALAVARLHMESAPGWPDARILASAGVVLCAHVLAGYAIGMWLPAVAAVPVVLVGDYLWNVYPPALEPLWLRHLVLPASGCCMNTSAVAPAGITAPTLMAVGLAALAVAAAAVSRRTPRAGKPADVGPVLGGRTGGGHRLCHHVRRRRAGGRTRLMCIQATGSSRAAP